MVMLEASGNAGIAVCGGFCVSVECCSIGRKFVMKVGECLQISAGGFTDEPLDLNVRQQGIGPWPFVGSVQGRLQVLFVCGNRQFDETRAAVLPVVLRVGIVDRQHGGGGGISGLNAFHLGMLAFDSREKGFERLDL